jgi:E3 ubiquitin-protein ligase UHRF1
MEIEASYQSTRTAISYSIHSFRRECGDDGVHAPLRAGIHGTGPEGAYSICMSGGYVDDKDDGDAL